MTSLVAGLGLASVQMASSARAATSCSPGDLYIMTGYKQSTGQPAILKYSGGQLTTAVSNLGTLPTPQPDALAVSTSGYGYFMASSSLAQGQAVTVYRIDLSTGARTTYPGATILGAPYTGIPTIPAGAINPANGIYYYAHPTTAYQWDFYAFDTKTNTSIGYVGRVNTGSITGFHGDIAFDGDGNLYLAYNGSTASMVKIAAANVPTTAKAVGTAIASTSQGSLTEPYETGLAYIPSTTSTKTLWSASYVASSSTPLRSRTPGTTNDSSTAATISEGYVYDLASCGASTTPKLKLSKNVAGRVNSGDQFRLTIEAPAGTALATATTTSTTSGVQTPAAGPIDATYGTTYTLREVAAGGTDLTKYTSQAVCTNTATGQSVPTSGSNGVFTVTYPAAGDVTPTVDCVLTNLPPATLTVTKALPGGRFAASDQFTVQVRTGGANGTVLNTPGNETTQGTGSEVVAGSGTTGKFEVSTSTAYTITESAGIGVALGEYAPTLTCTDSAGQQTGLPNGSAFNPASGYTLTPKPGAQIDCTISNRASSGAGVGIGEGLTCEAGYIYALASTYPGSRTPSYSRVYKINTATGVAVEYTAELPTSGNNITYSGNVNSLAISQGGLYSYYSTQRYAAEGDPAGLPVFRQDNKTGQTTLLATLVVPSALNAATGLVRGGINPTDGIYWISSSVGTTHHFWAYNTLTGQNYGYVGSLSGPVGTNGDLVFDQDGNMILVTSDGTNGEIWRINGMNTALAATGPRTALTPIDSSVSKVKLTNISGTGQYNGVTFDNDGLLWVSYATTNAQTGAITSWTRAFDPNNGAAIGSPLQVTGIGAPGNRSRLVVDLADCNDPGGLRLQKDYVDRAAANDNVVLSITRADAPSIPGGIVTTDGPATGLQTKVAGVVVGVPSQTYTLKETPVSGTSALANFSTTLSCVDKTHANAPVAVTKVSQGEYTLRFPGVSADDGMLLANVVCTYTNTPNGTLQLSKVLAGDRIVDADQFRIRIRTVGTTPTTAAQATTTGTGATVNNGTTSVVRAQTLASGATQAYTFDELGWKGGAETPAVLTSYPNATLTCVDEAGVQPAADLPVDLALADFTSIVPVLGSRIACVITNVPLSPGFTLDKVADPATGEQVAEGDEITYTVTGTNTGNTVLDPVTISDDLADVLDNATLVAGSLTASVGGAPVLNGTKWTWTGVLPVDGKVVITYKVKVNAGQGGHLLKNLVRGSATPPGGEPITPPEVETEHPIPAVPGFELTKVSDPESGTAVKAGDVVTYTVTGANTGNTVLDPATISDDLADVLDNADLVEGSLAADVGAAPVLNGTKWTWTGKLEPGKSVKVTYQVKVKADVVAGELVHNVASGTGTPIVPDPENPGGPGVPGEPIEPPEVETEHPIPPAPAVPGFELTKVADPESGSQVNAGDTITYTVTGSNTGNTVLDPATISDDLADVLDNADLVEGSLAADVGAAPVLNGTKWTWTGKLEPGKSVKVTYQVKVKADVVAGQLVHNIASGTGTPIVPDPENPGGPGVPGEPIEPPEVETEHPVPGVPGFELTKVADPESGSQVNAGDTITYTVTGSNTGNTVLDPVTISDDLADVLDNADLVEGSLSADVGAAPVLDGTKWSWTGVLPVDGKVVITYQVTVKAGQGGEFVHNIASGTGTPIVPDPENPGGPGVPGEPIEPPEVETEHPIPPAPATPGFELTKAADPETGAQVVSGETITYTVTGENTGNTVLDPVTITDDLADVLDNADLVEGSLAADVGAAPVLDGTKWSWTGVLEPGESVKVTYQVTVKAGQGGELVHNIASGTATPIVPDPENPGGPGVPGEPIEPPEVETEHPIPPAPAVPGFELTKSADPESGTAVNAGDTITYTVTGTNTGNTVLDPVTISDDLADVLDNADLVEGSLAADVGAAPVLDGTKWSWTGVLPVDGKVVITYQVKVKADVVAGELVHNIASGTGTPIVPDPENPGGPGVPGEPIEPPEVETEHPIPPAPATPGFELTKSADPESGTAVNAGDTITYTVTGTNTGNTVLDPVTITDDLADVLDNADLVEGSLAADVGAAPVLDGTKWSWTGVLPVDGKVVITYQVTVKADVVAGELVHNIASGTATPIVPDPENPGGPGVPGEPIEPPEVETEHPIPPAPAVPGFELTKVADPETGAQVVSGETITYTVTGANTGNTVLDPVTISDDLADVLDNADLVEGSLSADVGAAPVLDGTKWSWTGVLAAGESVKVTYQVTVKAGQGGELVHNIASGTGTPIVPDPENPGGPGVPGEPIEPPEVETEHPIPPAPAVPGFELTKSADPESGTAVNAGDTITYTVTGTNTGNTVLDPVTISDDLADVLDNADLVEGSLSADVGAAPVLDGTKWSWTGVLPVDGKVVITYQVTVKADVVAGQLVHNIASGTATPIVPDPENPGGPGVPGEPIEPPEVETEHPVGVPGFTLVKSSVPASGVQVRAGDEIAYSVTGSNTGNTVLDPVKISDDLADVLDDATLVAGSLVASVGDAPVLDGTKWSWSGSLAAGESVTISYKVTVKADVAGDAVLRNVASGSATPPGGEPIDPPEVETEHPVGVPGFTLVKSSDPASGEQVGAGRKITYKVTGSNTGNTVLNPVTISDDLADVLDNAELVDGSLAADRGTAPVLEGTKWTWTGILQPGESVTVTYQVVVKAGVEAGELVHNIASGTATPIVPDPENPEGPGIPGEPIEPPDVETEHPVGVPGFTLVKLSDPATGAAVLSGATITYTVTGSNTGNTSLDPVSIADDLADVLDNAELVAGSLASDHGDAPTLDGTKWSWTGSLAAGEKVNITYQVKVKAGQDGELVHNLVHGQAVPPNPENPEEPGEPITPPDVETEHPVGDPGFTLTKVSDPVSGSQVRAGDKITYTVTGSNTGSTVLDPATISDDLADVLDNAELVSGSLASDRGDAPSLTGTKLTWTGKLEPGEQVKLSYQVVVKAGVEAGELVHNIASGTATPIVPDPENPEGPGIPGEPIEPPDVETEHPVGVPGFTLVKSSDPASGTQVKAGDTVTYTVTGSNTGNTLLDPVKISDDLADVLDDATFVDGSLAASVGPVPALSGTKLSWSGALSAGQSVTITYQVKVKAGVAANAVLKNVAAGSATPPGGEPIEPPEVETEHPVGVPGFTLVKSSDPASGSQVAAGSQITYSVTGSNTGSTVLDPVTISDDLADVLDNTELVEGSLSADRGDAPVLAGTKLTWTGKLLPGEHVTITYKVKVKADVVAGELVHNIASGKATPIVPDPKDPEGPGVPGEPITPPDVDTKHPVAVPGFTLTKISHPGSGAEVKGGDTVAYTVTGSNTGNTVLDPVTIADDLADVFDNADLVSGSLKASLGSAPTLSGSKLSWTGRLAVGEKVIITYQVKVKAGQGGQLVHNVASGKATPIVSDPKDPSGPGVPGTPIAPPDAVTDHPVPLVPVVDDISDEDKTESDLAFTGADLLPAGGIGIALLALGLLAIGFVRRRA